MQQNKNLRFKILRLVLLAGIIPLIITAFISYQLTNTINREDVFKNIELLLTQKQNVIERYVAEREASGEIVASSDLVRSFIKDSTKSEQEETTDTRKMYSFLHTFALANHYTDIFIKDSDSNLHYALVDNKDKDHEYECGCRDTLLEGSISWSKVHQSDFYDDVVTTMTLPIYESSSNQEIIGTISFVQSQDILSNIVHEDIKKIGMSGDAYLIDSQKRLLSNTLLGDFQVDAALRETIDTAGTRLLSAALLEGDFGFSKTDQYIDYRGNNVLGALGVITIGNHPYGLLIEVDHSEAFSRVVVLQYLLTSFAILLVFISVFLALKMANSITVPIHELEKGINRIVKGDLNHKIIINSSDEIQSISDAFNSMTSELSNTLISKEKFRSIFDNMTDAVVVTSTEGALTYMNRTALNMTGYSEADYFGKDFREVLSFSPTQLDGIEALREHLISGIERHEIEMHISTRGNPDSLFKVDFSILFDNDDTPIEVIAVLSDITAQKKMEDALKEAAISAENANKAKGYFLANISHEIRTPLNTIIGFADYMKEHETDDSKLESLDVISHSGKLLKEIVSDVLDYSKIESGKLVQVKSIFSLEKLLNDMTKMFELNASKKQLRVETRILTDVPDYCYGDEYRIQQILVNLVSNAIKFTDEGMISIHLIYLDETVIFEVSDTGVGISDDDIQRIFSPFEQADVTTSRTHGGTGLGLAITKALVDMLNGTLDLTSELGVGTTFKVTMPLTEMPDIKGYDEAGSKMASRWIDSNDSLGDLAKEVIRRLPKYIENIDGAVSEYDPENIYLACHAMKGVAINYGMNILSDILSIMLVEIRMKEPDQAYLNGLLAMLKDLVGRIPDSYYEHELETSDVQSNHGDLMRVLVADDIEMNRMLIMRLLESMPVCIDFADNGEDTLALMDKHDYELLLLDIQMPVMNGLEVMQHLRGEKGRLSESTHIIIMSAIATHDEVERIKQLGCDDYLSKPIKGSELRSKVASLIADKSDMIYRQ